MINASLAFLAKLANDERDYLEQADIVLADGTALDTITNADIWQNGFSIEDAVSDDTNFQIGTAYVNSAKIVLNNIYDKFSEYNFEGARVVLYVGLDINGTPEMLRKGTYIVNGAEYDGALITLPLIDNMSKFDVPYKNSRLVYPASLGQIIQDVCSICDVLCNTPTFPHSTYIISKRPSDEAISCREIISYVAQIAGCFARCDTYGRLELKWYDEESLAYAFDNLDGGTFDTDEPLYPELQNYYNSTTGMTQIIGTRQDDTTNTVTGVNWFSFNGKTASTIYINSNSWFVLGGSTPSSSGSSSSGEINIFRRDGQLTGLYRQEWTSGTKNFLKFRYEGYTNHSASAQTEEYRLVYELFLISDGNMVLNIIQIPKATAYYGTSNIVVSAGTTKLSSMVGKFKLTKNTNNRWESNSFSTGYQSGDVADGGTFNPWNEGYGYNAAGFETLHDVHYITSVYTQHISTDDVVITGIRIDVETEKDNKKAIETYTSGVTGYMIGIEKNPLITTDNAQTIVTWLGSQLVGIKFRKIESTHSSDPTIEAGDVGVLEDRHNRLFPFLITRTVFSVGSAQTSICGAETPAKNSATRYSEATKTYVELRQQIVDEKTDRELALEELSERLEEKKAMYTTIETKNGVQVAWYMHDQPTVAESQFVWKMTTSAWGVSSNGGRTWNAGMTVDGDTIVRILQATGINAQWIKTGTLTIGGSNNTHGSIRVLNASGTQIGKWDNTGINVGGGAISGASITVGGSNNANGTLTVKNASGTVIGTWNKDGLSISKGAISGSSITLGGANNGNGILKVLNSSGSVIGKWDKDGLTATGNLTMKNGNYSGFIGTVTYPYYSTANDTLSFNTGTGFGIINNNSYYTVRPTGTNLTVATLAQTGRYEQHYVGTSAGDGFLEYVLMNVYSYNHYLFPTGTYKSSRYYLEEYYSPTTGSYYLHSRLFASGSGYRTELSLNGDQSMLYISAGSVFMDIQTSHQRINGKDIQFASSSSKRYKHSITSNISGDLDAHKLYDLKMKQFVFNDDHLLQYDDMKGKTITGFIAEDVEKLYPSASIHNENGQIESWDERRIIPAMLTLIQEQHNEIEKLKHMLER